MNDTYYVCLPMFSHQFRILLNLSLCPALLSVLILLRKINKWIKMCQGQVCMLQNQRKLGSNEAVLVFCFLFFFCILTHSFFSNQMINIDNRGIKYEIKWKGNTSEEILFHQWYSHFLHGLPRCLICDFQLCFVSFCFSFSLFIFIF